MFTPEYLADRIEHHGKTAQAAVLAHDRFSQLGKKEDAQSALSDAARHAAIFTALSAIAAANNRSSR